MKRTRITLMTLIAAALPAGCGKDNLGSPPAMPEPVSSVAANPASRSGANGNSQLPLNQPTELGKDMKTASGLVYRTLKVGSGTQIKPGERGKFHYTATIMNGEKFDSSRDRSTPWSHVVGESRAVQGFNEGISGMFVGETRLLTVPPNLAFGALGTFGEYAPGKDRNLDGALQAEKLPSIPPNSTIVYEVELLDIVPN